MQKILGADSLLVKLQDIEEIVIIDLENYTKSEKESIIGIRSKKSITANTLALEQILL